MKKLGFLLIITFFCCEVYSQSLTLANAGNSNYKILIPTDPDQNEVLAASKFQNYFKTITGVQLPIQNKENLQQEKFAILIANSRRFKNIKSIQHDGVVIKTEGSNLLICGGENRGVLYSVYTFFEKYLDCKFFALDEIKTPKKSKVEISQIDYQYSPYFSFRSYYSLENEEKEYADFNKQNYFFENRLYPAHSLAWLLPASKYFESNPEFFALIDGKRNPTQICFSSDGALKELIKILRLEMSLTPNQVWSVSHLDSPNYCHCNLCENKYKSGNGFCETLIPFVNKVARAFPEKTISTLAYNQSIFPSKLEKPEKNVEIMFCLTNLDRRYSITLDKSKGAEKLLKALQSWKKQTSDIFIWDYSVNYFHSLSPFPNIYTFPQNIKFFKDFGIKEVFMQGIGPQKGEFSELKSYIASKLLWNPNLDFNKLLDEFLINYYGNGWEEMKKYILTIDAESKKYQSPLNEYSNPTLYKNGFLSQNNILNYKKIIESTLSKVQKDGKFYNRINKEILTLEYAELEIQSLYDKNKDFNTKNDFVKKLNNFKLETQKNNIKNLKNGEFTVDEFINQKEK
ncbi:hypothetical protein CHRY9390_02319 [Chryseobacterium aquaeductus]|uniref:Alpha glucuronidase N-terminal domain-containing protein n=1 Tax=Chryseobacterium aquaeductus TaxID=2675056 RepID=A0A9N8MGZ8_9FLAO|nr:DUF4838 domain-containing protein [Chryseobacterium aquaeductus]CAA7331606.1 hypothetical protein CHRY9390_02319 [Chryseobacterium potabilaquae]CAD7811212.1 hypothetical protein CHRY9390_02319 [Chryseobacterium aquaeductus]